MHPPPAYSFRNSIFEVDSWTLLLARHCDGDVQPPLSDEATAFVLKHAKCGQCEQPITDIGAHEGCGKRTESPGPVLAKFEREHFPQLRTVMAKNARRRFVLTRRERLAAAGGQHTPQQLDALFAVQNGRCYYCWCKIVQTGPGRACQRDHYESVANGGGDGIQNIVLSCLACNAEKNARSGDTYRHERLSRAAPQTASRLRALHRAVAEFHRTCLSEAGILP